MVSSVKVSFHCLRCSQMAFQHGSANLHFQQLQKKAASSLAHWHLVFSSFKISVKSRWVIYCSCYNLYSPITSEVKYLSWLSVISFSNCLVVLTAYFSTVWLALFSLICKRSLHMRDLSCTQLYVFRYLFLVLSSCLAYCYNFDRKEAFKIKVVKLSNLFL